MLLQRLNEYADRLNLPPTLYSESPVRYIIELDASGRLLNPEPVDTSDPANARTRRGQPRLVPRVQRAVKIKPLLLSDNAEYTLGLAREDSNPARVAACHHAYLEQIERCAASRHEPPVLAVCTFLAQNPLAQLSLPADFDPSANLTFCVAGVFPVDLPTVQAFWAEQNDPDADADHPAPVMQCLICGQERPILRRLQTKIKGVRGGQTSGTSLISANAEAFESYGLGASLIAPTCAACGERFTRAINDLLADGTVKSHVVLGNATLAFWTRVEHPFSLLTFLDAPQPADVAALIEATRKGRPLPEVDQAAFYAVTLSASGGRAVVRDWLDTTVAEVKRRLATCWFPWQRIVGAYGDPPRPLGVYALAAATVRDPARELAPPTPRSLWRTALTGVPLPLALLYQAVRRNRAEQGVTYPRAALIKLALCSQQTINTRQKEDSMIQLDPQNTAPAYLCGRLLAVIEEAQHLAIPGAKATVVDRFYGTASSAPASVFGRLLRGMQPHLAKLKRDRPGTFRALQQRLEDIQAGLSGFPRVLTLEQQGLFALGYYHQRAADRAQAREAAARHRAAGQPAEADATEEITDFGSEQPNSKEGNK